MARTRPYPTEPVPMTPADAKEHAVELIRSYLKDRGWSASRLAREAGVSPSTVTRALDPKVNFIPSYRTMTKLLSAGLPSEILYGSALAEKSRRDYLERLSEAAEYKQTSRSIPIVGTVRAGVWADSPMLPRDEMRQIAILNERWLEQDHVGYVVGEENVDPEILPGSILIVRADWEDLRENDVVVVQKQFDIVGDHKFELSLYTVTSHDGHIQLAPRYGVPGLPGKVLRSNEIIKGPVVAIYQELDRRGRPLLVLPEGGAPS